jgi:carbon storage regulator
MLVIPRREGEEVVIGDPRNPIGVVRIASIRGDRVRIAFDFPRHVQVHRKEIAVQIVDEPGPEVLAKLRPAGEPPSSTPAQPAANGTTGQADASPPGSTTADATPPIA